MQNATIKVKGMSCEHCVKSVTECLTELDGVLKADVSLKDSKADVEFDSSKVSIDQMLSAIKEIEFEASL